MCYIQPRPPLPTPVLEPQDGKARPLHRAVQRGLLSFVSALLSTGHDPNATDSRQCTPMHWAAAANQAACITRLAAAQADPCAPNADLATPLHVAGEHGQAEAIGALLAAGAELEARDAQGRTPLWVAARAGQLAAVRALVAAGATVETREAVRGCSALCAAVSEGHIDVARELLASGADPEALSNCSCPFQASAAEPEVGEGAPAEVKSVALSEPSAQRKRVVCPGPVPVEPLPKRAKEVQA